jgi:hypothetical protein
MLFGVYCLGVVEGKVGRLSETIKAAGMREGVKWCRGRGKVGKTQ